MTLVVVFGVVVRLVTDMRSNSVMSMPKILTKRLFSNSRWNHCYQYYFRDMMYAFLHTVRLDLENLTHYLVLIQKASWLVTLVYPKNSFILTIESLFFFPYENF